MAFEIKKPTPTGVCLSAAVFEGHWKPLGLGPLFTPRAYRHNLKFFCPTCGNIWGETSEIPETPNRTYEPIKRGCCKAHKWHEEDHAGSLLLDLKFDLFTIGPEALKREVRLLLDLT